jgi:hypothetical protein
MATIFSTKDPNPGVWFKFDENDPDSGEIKIRVVNATRRNEIQKACNRKRVEYKNGQRFEVSDMNDDLFSQMLWEYAIVDWNGLEDDDGKTLVCTNETKLFLMQNHVGFAQFIGKCMEKLGEEEENRVAIIKKNSLNELSVSKKNPPAKDAGK